MSLMLIIMIAYNLSYLINVKLINLSIGIHYLIDHFMLLYVDTHQRDCVIGRKSHDVIGVLTNKIAPVYGAC